MSKPPSKTIFVGNIPYGLAEEQIVDIFSSAGKVLSFRLMYDNETGRPKGFGFAEYPDADSAASAVRNLNGYEIMNRILKVDFSDSKHDGSNQDKNTHSNNYSHSAMPSNGVPIPLPLGAQNNSSLPPLPLGVDLPPGLTCPDAISRTLNTLPPAQLLDVLSQMKTLASTDAGKATELLHQAPQLSYAIFQALLLMGLVSTDALSSVIESSASQPTFAPPAPPPQVPLPNMNQGGAYIPPPGSYPPGFPPPPPHMSGQLGMQMGTPPAPGHGLYPPPPPPVQQRVSATPQQQPPPAPQALPDTDALMQQVLAMPQELIDSLPPADRAQLLALRASFGR